MADPRLTPELVTRALAPLLSESRRFRIEEVLRHRLGSVTVVLENLHDPHNGAAAIRTSEAMGLVHLHVIELGFPFSLSRRVSQAAHKWLNIYIHQHSEQALSSLRERGFACWAALPPQSPPAGDRRAVELTPGRPVGREGAFVEPVPPACIPVSGPLALVFGNERDGLSRRARELCDGSFTIPMRGFTRSLNLSVSVAVALSDVACRRRAYLGRPGDLAPAAIARFRAAAYASSTPHAAAVVQRAASGLRG